MAQPPAVARWRSALARASSFGLLEVWKVEHLALQPDNASARCRGKGRHHPFGECNILCGAGVKNGIDCRDLGWMDGDAAGEALAAGFETVGPESRLVAEIGIKRLDRLGPARLGGQQALRAHHAIGQGLSTPVRPLVGGGADGESRSSAPHVMP